MQLKLPAFCAMPAGFKRTERRPWCHRVVLKRQTSCFAQDSPVSLFFMRSEYNIVQVVKFPYESSAPDPLPGSNALILDSTGSIHSIYREDQVLLGPDFYWEQLALVAALAPEGVIGVLGLGTGTVPRIIHRFWPTRKIHGWELDRFVLFAGRQCMGLGALEDSGALVSHVGDALAADATVEEGFAGIVVDLFSNAQIPEALQTARPVTHEALQKQAWADLHSKLIPGGVIIANLGTNQKAVDCLQDIITEMGEGGFFTKITSSNILCVTKDPAHAYNGLEKELAHIADGWTQCSVK